MVKLLVARRYPLLSKEGWSDERSAIGAGWLW
jgi:hypothetical protein